MQIDRIETEEALLPAIELSKDKLLGFRHLDAEVTEPSFTEDAAAAFNKIGEVAADR